MTAPAGDGGSTATSTTGPAADAAPKADATASGPATDATKAADAAPKADAKADDGEALKAELEALKAERDAHAAKLKEIEDSKLSETEKVAKELEELRAKSAKQESEILASKVATAKGLPADLIPHLTGDKAAMEKFADKVMAHINSAREDAAKGDAGKAGLGGVVKVNGTSLAPNESTKYDPKAVAQQSFARKGTRGR